MAKVKIDPATRPPLDIKGSFNTDDYLMYLIQDITKLPTADILGFFADLGRAIAEEGTHYMYEYGTRSMRKEIFDFFPGTSIPFSMFVTGDKRSKFDNPNVRTGSYYITVGFPSQTSRVDNTKLADIIMEKAILGGCDMAPFERPDPMCPKMYKKLMKEVQSRRMV